MWGGGQDKIDIRKRVAFINLKANEKSITIDLPGRDREGPQKRGFWEASVLP